MSWTDDHGVTHADDAQSGLFTRCGQSIVSMVDACAWDDPTRPLTCLTCLVFDGRDALSQTLEEIRKRGIYVDEAALDRLDRMFDLY